MAGCRKWLTTHVARGWSYKEIKVRCGSTSPSGYPYLCRNCEKRYEGVDWRREAALNGEAWGPEDY